MTWNGFRGAAKRLDDIDLPKVGSLIGVGEDEIHAVIDVEAAGSGFDSTGRPRILFERHWFYRHLKGAKLERAKREGLAVKKWSRATYGQDQYKLLERAMKIDEAAALKSASWGLGQVMGFNHKAAGFPTVQGMVRAFMEDEEHHLSAMIGFIKTKGLDKHLRTHNWAAFAKGYNGSGYRANKYDTKLAAAYRKWSKIRDTPWRPGQVEPEPAAPVPAPKPEPDTPTPKIEPIVPPGLDKPLEKSKTVWSAILSFLASSVLPLFTDWRVQLALVAVVAAAAFIIWRERKKHRDAARGLVEAIKGLAE